MAWILRAIPILAGLGAGLYLILSGQGAQLESVSVLLVMFVIFTVMREVFNFINEINSSE